MPVPPGAVEPGAGYSCKSEDLKLSQQRLLKDGVKPQAVAATERTQPRIVSPGWASVLRGQRICSGCVRNGAGASVPEASKADHARGAARPMGPCRMAGRVVCLLRNSVSTGQIDYLLLAAAWFREPGPRTCEPSSI